MIDLKIVLFGDGAVGKTSIARRFLGKGFDERYKKTIGVEFYVLNREYYDADLGEVEFRWLIWDLAGQPSFDQVRGDYYRGAKAGMAIYDISRAETYHNLPNWIEEYWTHTNGVYPFILVGNKKDLRSKGLAEVSVTLGRQYAESLEEHVGFSVPFIETSAKEGEQINKAFELLAKQVLYWVKKRI